jgi:hypothetical protein
MDRELAFTFVQWPLRAISCLSGHACLSLKRFLVEVRSSRVAAADFPNSFGGRRERERDVNSAETPPEAGFLRASVGEQVQGLFTVIPIEGMERYRGATIPQSSAVVTSLPAFSSKEQSISAGPDAVFRADVAKLPRDRGFSRARFGNDPRVLTWTPAH